MNNNEETAVEAATPESEAEVAEIGGVITLTLQNFEQEVLRSTIPVAIDCWADWCGPCKQFSPIFEATAEQYAGIVKFAKLDSDGEPALSAGLGVQALPTTLMFYKGQLVNVAEGALPASAFQQWIYQTLAALKQYEAQLSTESEAAIEAAVQNLAMLNEMMAQAEQEADPASQLYVPPTSSSGLILDPNAPLTPPANNRPPERGKTTASGLYIP
ncbi:MAG: thioredoxin domain-containing protein [Chloroflexia bacterium]